MTEWFKGVPIVTKKPIRQFRVHWGCPREPCDGEMIFNGFTWPTADPDYHHTCNKCKYTAAISGAKYPCNVWEEE